MFSCKHLTMPWPRVPGDHHEVPDFYGPERRPLSFPIQNPASTEMMYLGRVLEKLFGLQAGDCEKLGLEIKPAFYCDYGVNIKFTGQSNPGLNFSDLISRHQALSIEISTA